MGSWENRGIQIARVEMKEARYRALTQEKKEMILKHQYWVEMKEALRVNSLGLLLD